MESGSVDSKNLQENAIQQHPIPPRLPNQSKPRIHQMEPSKPAPQGQQTHAHPKKNNGAFQLKLHKSGNKRKWAQIQAIRNVQRPNLQRRRIHQDAANQKTQHLQPLCQNILENLRQDQNRRRNRPQQTVQLRRAQSIRLFRARRGLGRRKNSRNRES